MILIVKKRGQYAQKTSNLNTKLFKGLFMTFDYKEVFISTPFFLRTNWTLFYSSIFHTLLLMLELTASCANHLIGIWKELFFFFCVCVLSVTMMLINPCTFCFGGVVCFLLELGSLVCMAMVHVVGKKLQCFE